MVASLPVPHLVVSLVEGRRGWVPEGARAKEVFCASDASTLHPQQPLWGNYPTVLTPGHYTHDSRCPHLIRALQWVLDHVFLPMCIAG